VPEPDAASSLDARSVGERIERLLDASAASGPLARERSEELIRLVADLYGAGLERVLELAYDAGALSDDLLDALADDELVAGLLLVHGLHPYAVEERVARALDKVRPYMGTHGGDVELIEVTDEGVARLRMLGSCDGCASSAVTLDLAVKDAVEAAAPEIVRIEVVEDTPAKSSSGLISVDSLSARLRSEDTDSDGASVGGPVWEPIGRLDDLPPSPLWTTTVGGLDIVICRIGTALYAYRDGCASCDASLATASVEKRLGTVGSAVLTCPGCRTHFDVRRAGVGIDDETLHLEPLPLLDRDGTIEIAVPNSSRPSAAAKSPVPA
jgi:Fe-S cluster biogenesis protein NfuA/nitrite reductase/ring-hydroxylating ferredoxin subunit